MDESNATSAITEGDVNATSTMPLLVEPPPMAMFTSHFIHKYEGTLLGQLTALLVIGLVWSYLQPKFHQRLYKFHSSQSYWSGVQRRSGYFGSCSKELMWNSMSCLQHVLAGSLMAFGWLMGEVRPDTVWEVDPMRRMLIFFRLGVIAEVAFEVLDIWNMMRGTGMWKTTAENPKIHSGAYVSALAHHLPGLVLVFPLNLWCSCVGLWQQCAVGLELGGAASIFLVCLRESLLGRRRSFRTRLGVWTTDLVSLGLLVWIRFFIVTPAMYEIGKVGLEMHCKTTYAVIVGSILMTVFNVMWLMDVCLKVLDSTLHLVVPTTKSSPAEVSAAATAASVDVKTTTGEKVKVQ